METKQQKEELLKLAKSGKESRGKKEFINFLNGEKLTLKQAILANCYCCMGYYFDGKVDCKVLTCPLHPAMPYRKGEKVIRKILSEEQKQASSERLKKARAAKVK